MQKYTCERCGKCCYVFNQRKTGIRFFLEDECFFTKDGLISALAKNPYLPQLSKEILFELFQHADKFIEIIDEKKTIRIPTKEEFSGLSRYTPFPSKIQDECLFLRWDESGRSCCIIHGQHPLMCQNYPENKAYYCLQHPERKYTDDFFNYQHKRIGFVINTINMLYQSETLSNSELDLLTLLMDYGKFDQEKLILFLKKRHLLSDLDIVKIFDRLIDLGLIFKHNFNITGISFAEINHIVDNFIEKHG